MEDEFLGTLLTADKELCRDEPEIAANIGIQLEHMGLQTWSISIRRRIRDTVSKLQPKKIIEVGCGIGHLSAWILDHLAVHGQVESYDLVEQGNRFAVILTRLTDRYSKVPSRIIVGEAINLASQTNAWKLSGMQGQEPPLMIEADLIIVNLPPEVIAENIEVLLRHLSSDGVLLTVEPIPPVGDLSSKDPSVIGFNRWMELIKSTNQSHNLAFAPLFGGSIVAWKTKN